MDLILVIIGFLLILLGIAGSFLPIIPGPLTGWVGLLVLHLTDGIEMNAPFLVITFLIALAIFILDYIIPIVGTKRFGGSKSGMIGTSIGLLVGLFSPIPFGIVIGPFLGALIGEMIHRNDFDKATRAAFGSFLGFIASTFLKFIVAVIFLGFFIAKLSDYSGNWY